MVGGAGDDHYWVENPGDTVVELDGEGTDTVLSQIDYTLPEHVENLYLRSTNLPITDPVRGEGNASDNVLLGNFVNNVLIGGGGNDTIWADSASAATMDRATMICTAVPGDDTYIVEGISTASIRSMTWRCLEKGTACNSATASVRGTWCLFRRDQPSELQMVAEPMARC